MPTFQDYEAFESDDDFLDLPIHGHTYRIHPMGQRDGILLERYRNGDEAAMDGKTEEDILRMTLGPAYDQMVEHNAPRTAVARAHMTAMAFHEGGVEMARRVWDRSIDPELGAAFKAALEGAATAKTTPTGSTPSKSSAAAARTRSRASTSGTSSRKTTRPGATAKARKTSK